MDQIEMPDVQVWETRRKWFESQFDIEEHGGAVMAGEHASALLVDLQAIYCTGAYISVIILACTIIDAHLREVEADSRFDGGMLVAFTELTSIQDLDWLRTRRNRLVHFKPQARLEITVDDQWLHRDLHEADARRAIGLVSKVLFENSWV